MIGHRHYHSAYISTVSQHDIHQILLNIEELFLAIFLIVSFCAMLQLFAFYFVYVTYHRVRQRVNPVSPPSYEAYREDPGIKQRPQFSE